jgi:hypothetical protein
MSSGIDLSNLAFLMLKWEQQRRALDELEQGIKDTVLALGQTQTVGNVRASYSGGRKTYNYQAAVESYHDSHPEEAEDAMDKFGKMTYDYRAVCKELLIEPGFTESPPSVSLKLMTETA